MQIRTIQAIVGISKSGQLIKHAVFIIIALASIFCSQRCRGDEPNISYAQEMPKISEDAKHALASVLTAANVQGCVITSTVRTCAEQAKVMYGFITTYGVAAARNLYGGEGNQVVDVYVAQTNANQDEAATLAAMAAKIKAVLPEAINNHHLMHVDRPGYDVFDVSLDSIPGDKRDSFIKAAKASSLFHRVLSPEEGEKTCCHFEFKKSQ